MRLYLDQMLQVAVAEALRRAGHDVLRANETGLARSDDWGILGKAVSEGRVLVTLDEHFGDWVLLPLKDHSGVIRIKVHPTTSANVCEVLLPFLRGRDADSFKNHLIILSRHRARWIQTG